MANENGIISAPIYLKEDVYTVVGLEAENGYYDLTKACCNEHGQINPNAKFKPTRAGGTPETPSDWWRGTDGMCGFNIPRYDTPGNKDAGFIHDLISGAAAWEYLAPRKGVDWSRLNDFNGYNHNAGEIFGAIDADSYVLSNSAGDLTIRITPPYQQAQGQLLPADFTIKGKSLSEFYLGIFLWQESSSKYILRTSTEKGVFSTLTVKNTGITGKGEWKAMLFLSSVEIDPLQGTIGDYIAARHTDYVTLELISINVVRQIFVYFNKWIGTQYRQAEVTMTLINNHPTDSFTFTTPKVVLLKQGTLGVVGQATALDQVVGPKSNTTLTLTMNTLIGQTAEPQTLELQGTASDIVSENKPTVIVPAAS